MDWGVVAAVVVGLAFFLAGLVFIVVSFMGLVVRGMKKKSEKVMGAAKSGETIKAGDAPKCPMPMCPMNKEMEKVISSLKGTEQAA